MRNLVRTAAGVVLASIAIGCGGPTSGNKVPPSAATQGEISPKAAGQASEKPKEKPSVMAGTWGVPVNGIRLTLVRVEIKTWKNRGETYHNIVGTCRAENVAKTDGWIVGFGDLGNRVYVHKVDGSLVGLMNGSECTCWLPGKGILKAGELAESNFQGYNAPKGKYWIQIGTMSGQMTEKIEIVVGSGDEK